MHTNQRLMVEELQKRGATYSVVDKDDELLSIHYKGKTEYLLDRFSSKAPYHMVKVSADKHLAKSILKTNNVCVPEGQVFTGNKIESALLYASTIYPVVLKPNWGSHGNHVQVDIRDAVRLEQSIRQFSNLLGKNEPFIIEKYHQGSEHRVLITALGGIAVVRREPASVVGDGINTIEYLAKIESDYRIALKKQTPTSLCPIVIDKEVERNLELQSLSLTSVPHRGERIFLRQESNLAKGGRAIDMTDDIHESVKEVALRALCAFPGLPCAGLDLLCEDISQPLSDYVILEINSNPGLAMHTYPTVGQSRNVAKLLVDVMFEDFFCSY